MENWESKLNHTDAPNGSVPSHREALRSKLQNPPRRSRARTSVVTVALLVIVGATGLTIANPDWVNDVVKIVTREARFVSEDGKQEVHVKTVELSGPADSVALHLERMKEQGQVGEWTFDPADPANAELLKLHGEKKMVFVEADVTTKEGAEFPVDGKRQKTMVIESRDGGQTFTMNGDKITAEQLAQIQSEHGMIREVHKLDGGAFMTTESTPEVISGFTLGQNYPNPFNPTTQIPFELKEAMNVKLRVYDMTGREVAMLLDGHYAAGSHTVQFDGSSLASGTYLYKLDAGGNQFSRTMVLMK